MNRSSLRPAPHLALAVAAATALGALGSLTGCTSGASAQHSEDTVTAQQASGIADAAALKALDLGTYFTDAITDSSTGTGTGSDSGKAGEEPLSNRPDASCTYRPGTPLPGLLTQRSTYADRSPGEGTASGTVNVYRDPASARHEVTTARLDGLRCPEATVEGGNNAIHGSHEVPPLTPFTGLADQSYIEVGTVEDKDVSSAGPRPYTLVVASTGPVTVMVYVDEGRGTDPAELQRLTEQAARAMLTRAHDRTTKG